MKFFEIYEDKEITMEKFIGKEESLKWDYVKPLKVKEAIDIFEKMTGSKIPSDIRSYIVKYNNGRPSKKTFNTDASEGRVIKSLLSFNASDADNIYDAYLALSKENEGLIPVASDPSGNYICFTTGSKDIVLWLHETNKTEKIASSFNDFLKKLY